MSSETMRQKLYELSFILSPDIKEVEITSRVGKIRELIAGKKGEVSKEEAPQKRRLAYPIKHQREGYFGYLHFSSPAESAKEIRNALAFDNSVLRHLIIAVDKKQLIQMKKPALTVATAPDKIKKIMQKAKAEESIFKKEGAVSHIEEHKVELEELDKKLEEILNK